MTFEQWWEEMLETLPETLDVSVHKEIAKDAWDFQQEHIEALAETIEDFEAKVRRLEDGANDV